MRRNAARIMHHPVLGPTPLPLEVSLTFNGEQLTGFAGETVGVALLAYGIRTLRHAGVAGEPRGMYCAIGHCFECQVVIDGRPGIRACLTPVEEGMHITSMPDVRFPRPEIGADGEG